LNSPEEIAKKILIMPINEWRNVVYAFLKTKIWSALYQNLWNTLSPQIQGHFDKCIVEKNYDDMLKILECRMLLNNDFKTMMKIYDEKLLELIPKLNAFQKVKLLEVYSQVVYRQHYPYSFAEDLIKKIHPHFNSLDSLGIMLLCKALVNLRYRDEYLLDNIKKLVLENDSKFLNPDSGTMNANLLNFFIYMNEDDTAHTLISEIYKLGFISTDVEPDIAIRFYALLASFDPKRYFSHLVTLSQCIAKHPDYLSDLTEIEENKIIFSNYLALALGQKGNTQTIDLRLMSWMKKKENGFKSSQQFIEEVICELLRKIYKEIPQIKYLKHPFEYDIYFPKKNLVVEIFGDIHYYINQPDSKMRKSWIRTKQAYFGNKAEFKYLNYRYLKKLTELSPMSAEKLLREYLNTDQINTQI